MQIKPYTKAIIVSSIIATALLSIFTTSVVTTYAFLGFGLFPGIDQGLEST